MRIFNSLLAGAGLAAGLFAFLAGFDELGGAAVDDMTALLNGLERRKDVMVERCRMFVL